MDKVSELKLDDNEDLMKKLKQGRPASQVISWHFLFQAIFHAFL